MQGNTIILGVILMKISGNFSNRGEKTEYKGRNRAAEEIA